MKKCFLLISIVLIAFGFSFNLNAINTSKRDKNNNIEQVSSSDEFNNTFANNGPLVEAKNAIEIVWEDQDTRTPANLIVTPTTATVEYEYFSNETDLNNINFRAGSNTDSFDVQGNKDFDDINNDNDKKENNDYKYYYTGSITTDEILNKNETYHADLAAYSDTYNQNFIDASTIFQFTTPTFNEIGNFNDENKKYNVITSSNSPTVDFEFIASKAKYTDWTYSSNKFEDNSMDRDIPPLKVDWVDIDNENKVIGSTEKINKEENKYSGTITANDLSSKELYNTKLIVYDEFGTYESDPTNYLYESKEFSFNLNNNDPFFEEYNVEPDGNSATISYTIDPGIDVNEEDPLIIKKVWWENNDNKNFDSSPNEASDDSGLATTGELTAVDLMFNEEYNTTIKATLQDTQGNIYNIQENISFNVDPWTGDEIEISTTNDIEEKENSATIDYTVIATKNNYGIPISIKEIKWENNDDKQWNDPSSGIITEPEFTDADNGIIKGEIEIKGLKAGETYSNTKLTVVDKEQNTSSTEVAKFDTIELDEEGKISPKNPVTYEEDIHKATVNYEFSPAKSGNTFYSPKKITWISDDGSQELGTSNNFGEKDDDGKYNSSVTANELIPGTEYNQTKLIMEDTKGNKWEEEVETFSTLSGTSYGIVSGEIAENTKKGNSATINYYIKSPTDIHEDSYKLINIQWIYEDENKKEQILAEETLETYNKEINGEMTTNKLETKTEYKTYLIVYYEYEDNNSKNFQSDNIEFTSGTYLIRDAILGAIALAVILVITLIVLLLIYGYKKRRRVN